MRHHPDSLPSSLSRRERQILEIIYRLGQATAADVLDHLADPPTYTTIRGLLRILERKGYVQHEVDGQRYLYQPSVSKSRAGRSMISHVMNTFFDGSPARAMAALLGDKPNLTEEEMDHLTRLIRAEKKRRKR